MKKLLLALPLALAACAPFAGQQPNIDIGAVIRDTVEAVDKNDDGVITNREVKDSEGNVVLWTSVASALLGLFGLSRAQQAHGLAKHVEKETDEQWDAIKKP